MTPLIKCDYQELLHQQPVSRSCIAVLQNGAVKDDPVCLEWFRKNMISLGAYIALQTIQDEHLDRDYVLAHIDADYLNELGFRRSFSEWGNENIHIEIVTKYIQDVIVELYIKTYDGVNVEKTMYRHTADALKQWREGRKEDPSADELAWFASVAPEVARAVIANEAHEHEMEEKRKKEEDRFRRLKEAIRDSKDLSFQKKLDFLETLVRMPPKIRPFFYDLYGIDDGKLKTVEEIAGRYLMTPEQAEEYYQEMFNKHHRHYITCVRQDSHFDLMLELMDFLIENEQNRKGYEEYWERMCRKRNTRSKKL